MNKTDKAVNAMEANRLQKQWMDLDSNGSKSEIQRVINEYGKLPTSYIVQSDSGSANVFYQGTIVSGWQNLTVQEAEKLASNYNVQTSLRWNTKGEWFNV